MKLIIMTFFLMLSFGVNASSKTLSFTVITPDDRARLCKKPDCPSNKALIRIPTGTILKTSSKKTFKHGIIKATWYKTKYKNVSGWISEFNLKANK